MIHCLLTRSLLAVILITGMSAPGRAPWPAEAEDDATNLSRLAKGFNKDLSGAVWNPVTNTLWVCRNGPAGDSRLWALGENADGELAVLKEGDTRAEWRRIGEAEGVTFARFDESIVFLVIEDEGAIHELDVSRFEKPVLVRSYDLSAVLPDEGGHGAEGLTFLPDEQLISAGFRDATGELCVSKGGLGGLMLVGHQNGGGLYAFDLSRKTGAIHFVGTYRVPSLSGEHAQDLSRTVALEFDRSSGLLYTWHSRKGKSILTVSTLASQPGLGLRDLQRVAAFDGPGERNFEGLAIVPAEDCGPAGRALFLTVDDSKKHSLLRFDRFQVGCEPPKPEAPPK